MSFRVRPPPREGRALTRDACLRCHDDRYGWDCVACTCPPLADGVGQSSSGSVPPFVNGSMYAGGESCSNDRCVTSTRDGRRTRVRWVRVSLPRSHRHRRRRRRVNVTDVRPVSTCAARRCVSTSTTAGAATPSPAPLRLTSGRTRPPDEQDEQFPDLVGNNANEDDTCGRLLYFPYVVTCSAWSCAAYAGCGGSYKVEVSGCGCGCHRSGLTGWEIALIVLAAGLGGASKTRTDRRLVVSLPAPCADL